MPRRPLCLSGMSAVHLACSRLLELLFRSQELNLRPCKKVALGLVSEINCASGNTGCEILLEFTFKKKPDGNQSVWAVEVFK